MSTDRELLEMAAKAGYKPPVTFQNHCMCGGYAHSMNGRDIEQPHMVWCRQYQEYAQYRKNLHAAAKIGRNMP